VDQPTVVARERAGGRRALRRVALAAPTFVFRESGSQSHGFPAIPEVKALTNEAVCGLLREAAENGPRVRAIGDRPQRSNNEDPGCRWGRHASSRTPRFLATGETTELAPRDPDPNGSYEWRVVDAPPDSEATVGTDPVTEFTPDVPGRYWIGLDAPDGDHRLTVHAFPSSYEGVDVEGGSGTEIRDRTAGNAPVDYAEPRGDGGVGRPRMRLDASVELGETDGDEEGGDEKGSDEKSSDEKSSDGTGKPEIVVRATPTPNPHSSLGAGDLRVTFIVDDRDVESAVAEGRRNPRDALRTSDDGRELRVPAAAVADRLRVHGVAVAAEPGQEPRVSVADAVAVDRSDGGVGRHDEGDKTSDRNNGDDGRIGGPDTPRLRDGSA